MLRCLLVFTPSPGFPATESPASKRIGKTGRAPQAAWALAAVLTVFAWQAAMVHLSFAGNWSALFCTGTAFGVPPALAGEHLYLFPGAGWDGQFYHDVAHDPLIRGDLWKSIDAPRLRYSRILVPALANLLALGYPARVDWAYRVVILGFVFLGAYWLSRIAVNANRRPAWGLAFCLVPASICSIDRMVTDIALAALCLAFALYANRDSAGLMSYLVLVLAALTRETGLLLIAAYCGWLLYRRHFGRLAIFATAALPALSWYAYVRGHTRPFLYHSLVSIPFSGLVDRFVHPMAYALPVPEAALDVALDYVALLGLVLALLLVCRALRKSGATPATIAMALFALLMVTGWRPGDWLEAYDYARIFSPLLLLLGLRALESAEWLWALPLAMALPRMGLLVGLHTAQAVRALL